MTKREHEIILAEKLQEQKKQIIKGLQFDADYLVKMSIESKLRVNDCRCGYTEGFEQGSALAYELAAIWLQRRINEIKEEGLLTR